MPGGCPPWCEPWMACSIYVLMTVFGGTLGEAVAAAEEVPGQDVIRPR